MLNIRLGLLCIAILFAGANSSAQWVQTNGPAGGTVTSLARGGGFLYAGTSGSGVYRSSDNGAHWSQANAGLSSLYITFLAVKGSALLAGSDNIYRSTDDGLTWAAANPGTGFAYTVALNDSVIMVSADTGIVRSTDDGASWTLMDFSGYGTVGLPLAAGGSLAYTALDDSLYRSTDFGTSWVNIDSGLDAFPRTLYVDGTTCFIGNSLGELWRFRDSTLVMIDSSHSVSGIVLCFARGGSELFAASTGGIFGSSDDGDH